MRWLGILAALATLAPAVLAQAPPPAEAPLSLLVYHAPGGREPDPLASPLAPPPPSAHRLPATFFDRVERAPAAPENAPERALAHFRAFQDLLATRERIPAQVELRVEGALLPDALRVSASANESVALTLVVFEHAVPLRGRPQPYVARFALEPEETRATSVDVALDPAWDVQRLGVVAVALRGDEVVQSATWIVGQQGPTVQRAKSVLVEHVTASWCDPCAPADEALALLATQRGVAGPLPSGDVRYFREPSLQLYAGLALGGLAALVLMRRRDA